ASSNTNYYAFGTEEGLLTMLDVEIEFKAWEVNIGGIVTDISFNGKGNYIVGGSNNKRLILADVLTGEELWRTSAFGGVSGVAMSYRGENIAVGTAEGLAVYYERQLDNQAPVATIESITPSTALPGTPIVMNGSAVDSDGEIVDYLWNSSKDGNLSNERIFTVSNLTLGLHVITFSAQDNEGRWSKEVSANIGVGDFPEATIDSVSGCDLSSVCVISEGVTIEFDGSAASTASNDTEIIGYHWSSDIDGNLSDQISFTTSGLSLGPHTITFRAVNDIGFWSANATVSLLINGVPVSDIISAEPNPVQPGEDIFLVASGNDPDGGSLTYIWSSDTLFFANDENQYVSQDNGSKIVTSESDMGEHDIYLRVVDSYGISSESSMVTVQILSPPSVTAQCGEDYGWPVANATLGQPLLFNAIGSDRDGGIVLYEWDFNSTNGDIDSVDFQGASFATHSYNSTPVDSYYTVVVRVTDNDGLVTRDTCTVEIVQPTTPSSSGDSSSSGGALGSISEIASFPVMAGIGLFLLIIGAVAFYMMRRDDYIPYVPPKAAPVTGAAYMESLVPEEVVTETMTVECPECSARMDIPNISGAQQIQCSECGLEGEIEL
ncbi:MAG TPA: PKD domain-containing protein, partial [Marine Group III euryarchaeote]|nr:PKD domain-containing protein [Marine Group III euryarchaeote]